ncbi:two-component system histidine kinase PnpS [Salisediminibacterium halotolerans]|uniref:two-component system histidine kinase PnpS n=1 Tax=Salisediminibacterium halotolerans TaxID=517425 RepID=UPI000EB110C5|nr:ATP-binding protein [Salisediminibacterium halotolerans]RLJ80868.1 two-component system phosphate regulon sensor histidine kinase PhoR [Actinophytocola xinjiangensis]RPE84033.1 two-component system phosphate regulon sensor histidine kinase PhoR [Salisediminibacterium halotolerans]TWG37815.1 two-component system phosphate regulon sensor histidine kinase PhoR [Salisediminibacterium halotolerans]GEL09089.1 PAS domain-containing sensor histidine kinase [Salisediminibacterium halotolerans]
MNSYRFRLLVPLSLIVLIVLAGLGLLLGPFFNEFYVERMEDRLAKEADTAAYHLESSGALAGDNSIETAASELAERLDMRVTVLNTDGDVTAETEDEEASMDNHSDRPEIIEAASEGTGQATRYSDTVGRELLYYAVQLEEDGEEAGFIRLGMATDELQDVNSNIWTFIVITFLIAFTIILVFASKLTNELIRPIEDARRVANQLAKGNYRSRTYEGGRSETGELNRSLNMLAQNLTEITNTYESQKERLETLIENMGSGLILIDEKGTISLLNRTCREIFDEDTDSWQGELYYNVITHKKINSFIQEVFLTEERERKQLKIPIGIYIRHFDVHGAPIIAKDGNLKGIVLVFHDITELKKLEQARKDFVANVSHELKTPVTSLKGFTETLLGGAMEDPAMREKFIKIIADESDRLETLIYELLELSKIEDDQFQLDWQQVNLLEEAEATVNMLSDKAEAKSMKIIQKHEGEPVLSGDPARVRQILMNLINNAIVYTPANGEITVRMKEQADQVVLEVEDTGIGMSKKEIPRIFERFYRVDRARSRNSGGTGLGLAIVKHLAEAHQAKLTVDSKPGKGTTFRIAFQKADPDAEA